MSLAGSLSDRKERPAYVSFSVEVVEDKPASAREGRFVGREIEMAHITAPYSRDVFKIEVPQWFANMTQEVNQGRMPDEWLKLYRDAYDKWKLGQELPLSGTPMKGWGIISPAMQETLIRMHVRTVEDLAAINDEGIKRIGMGAVDLKNKAVAWLAQLNDKGPLTMQMAALQKEMANLQMMAQTLKEQNEKLQAMLPKVDSPVAFVEPPAEITASDIIEEEPKGKKGKR